MRDPPSNMSCGIGVVCKYVRETVDQRVCAGIVNGQPKNAAPSLKMPLVIKIYLTSRKIKIGTDGQPSQTLGQLPNVCLVIVAVNTKCMKFKQFPGIVLV